MVVIRLARHGAKHNPFYHVTVADKRARRDGAFIERIGFYNPVARGQAQRLQIDMERLSYWQSVGCQTSQRVTQLIKEAKRNAKQTELEAVEGAETETSDTETKAEVDAVVAEGESASEAVEASETESAEAKAEESTEAVAEESTPAEVSTEDSEEASAAKEAEDSTK